MKKLLFLVGLIITTFHYGNAQSEQKKALKDSLSQVLQNPMPDSLKTTILYRLGDITYKHDELTAYNYFSQILTISNSRLQQDPDNVFFIKEKAKAYNGIGKVSTRYGAYDKALSMHLKAKQILEELNDTAILSSTLRFIGNVYKNIDKPEKALEYYHHSLMLRDPVTEPTEVYITYMLQSIAYKENGQYSTALASIKKAEELLPQVNQERIRLSNLYENQGAIYRTMGKHDTALIYLYKSQDIIIQQKDSGMLATNYRKIALNYQALNKNSKALQNFENSNKTAKLTSGQLGLTITRSNFYQMSDIYAAMGNAAKAYELLKTAEKLNDSVNVRDTYAELGRQEAAMIFDRKISEDSLRYSNELLLSEMKTRKTKARLLYGSLVALIVVLLMGLVLITLRRRLQMQSIQQQLVESDLKLKHVQEEKLKQELEFNRKDLTNMAISLGNKKHMTEELIEKLEVIQAGSDDYKTAISKLVRELLLQIQSEEENVQLQLNIDELNARFYEQLIKMHPKLSKNERDLCGLVRTGLSNKDIASMKNINHRSVLTAKFRIKTKIGLGKKDDLYAYLSGI